MPLPGYYTLLLQGISFHCTEQRECVKCDNLRGDTQVGKKRKKENNLLTSLMSPSFCVLSGSGAMIAVIVLGIIILLAFLLIILKTYNR